MNPGDRVVLGRSPTGRMVAWPLTGAAIAADARVVLGRTTSGHLVAWPVGGTMAAGARVVLGRAGPGHYVAWTRPAGCEPYAVEFHSDLDSGELSMALNFQPHVFEFSDGAICAVYVKGDSPSQNGFRVRAGGSSDWTGTSFVPFETTTNEFHYFGDVGKLCWGPGDMVFAFYGGGSFDTEDGSLFLAKIERSGGVTTQLMANIEPTSYLTSFGQFPLGVYYDGDNNLVHLWWVDYQDDFNTYFYMDAYDTDLTFVYRSTGPSLFSGSIFDKEVTDMDGDGTSAWLAHNCPDRSGTGTHTPNVWRVSSDGSATTFTAESGLAALPAYAARSTIKHIDGAKFAIVAQESFASPNGVVVSTRSAEDTWDSFTKISGSDTVYQTSAAGVAANKTLTAMWGVRPSASDYRLHYAQLPDGGSWSSVGTFPDAEANAEDRSEPTLGHKRDSGCVRFLYFRYDLSPNRGWESVIA